MHNLINLKLNIHLLDNYFILFSLNYSRIKLIPVRIQLPSQILVKLFLDLAIRMLRIRMIIQIQDIFALSNYYQFTLVIFLNNFY